MIIKNLFISLFLGLVYLFISTSLIPTSNFWIQYILLLLIPFPIFLVIFSFSFWTAIVAFFPITVAIFFPHVLMFFNLSYAVNINILLTIPLLFIFIFINLKLHKVGKYIPLVVVGYAILLFVGVFYYINLHSLSLPDLILDRIYTVLFHISSSNPDILSTSTIMYAIYTIAFFLPTVITLLFYFILVSNYILANYLVNKDNSKFFNLQIGTRLPDFYIYIFVVYIIGVLISHYLLKISPNTMYVIYNIAVMLIIPFMVPGLEVINKNKFFFISLIMLLILLSFYIVVIICLVGFLKEVKEAKFFNIKYFK